MVEIEFTRGDTFFFKSKLKLHSGEEITKEQIESAFVTVREYPRNRFSYNISKDFR